MTNRIQLIATRLSHCSDIATLFDTAAYLDCLADHADCDDDTRRDALALASELDNRALALEA